MNIHVEDVEASFTNSSKKRYKHPTYLGGNWRLYCSSHPFPAVFEDAYIGLI